MKKVILLPIIIAFTYTLGSCAIGIRGVSYSEMVETPILSKDNERLIVETKNSKFHSALAIYKIEVQANHEEKELIVSAKQALTKRLSKKFAINLNQYQVKDISGWTINWLDPDGKKTELRVENKVP